MQVGSRVEVVPEGDGSGTRREGRVISRVILPPLEIDRYFVRLTGEDRNAEVPLERLIYISRESGGKDADDDADDDSSGDDGDDSGVDDMMYAHGQLCFCTKHRLEICGACGYNFRMQNLMSEMSSEIGSEDALMWAERIEEAMMRAGCAARRAPPPGEPMRPWRPGGSVSINRNLLLDGSVLPHGTDPSKLGACHPTQLMPCLVYNHMYFPVSDPLLKEMRVTIQEIATFQETAPPSRAMIGLQDEAQSEVMWICIDSIKTLARYPGGAVPLMAVRWYHGMAGDPIDKLFSYIDQGVQPTEFRCSAEEIQAFAELLARNGERLDPAYSARIRTRYLPRVWNVSALGPIVVGEEGNVAKLVVPLPGSRSAAATENACDQCNRSDVALLKCAKCKVAKYCGRECQALAWKRGHKKTCRPPSS